VSYLNTKPLIYGFEQGMMKDAIELVIDYPAKIADALIKDEIDIGLIPVAAIPKLKEHHIVSDYCIAADGEVASVCLFSEVPLNEIKTVLLDYQSRTSVALVQLLMKEYWKINPAIKNADNDFREKINGTTAAVVIGDRALEQRKTSSYIYDLGLAWKEYTGLPFVFAAWVSNKPLSDAFVKEFNAANQHGLARLEEVIKINKSDVYSLEEYYTTNIKFVLDSTRRLAIALFLEKLKST
jgi:chorismate dehydratase